MPSKSTRSAFTASTTGAYPRLAACDDAGMVWVWLGVFGVVALAAAAQAVSGFGFALIGTPLVALLVGPKEAVVGLTMIGLVLVAQLSLRGRGHMDRPTVGVVTAAAIVGMPLGLVVLVLADDRVLTVVIAIAVIAFSLLLWRGARVPAGRGTDVTAGFTAGILSTSTGTSGPPIVIALSAKQLEPAVFRATISAIFLVQSVGRARGVRDRRADHARRRVGGARRSPGRDRRIARRRARVPAPRYPEVPAVVLGMLFLSGVVALFGALWS